MSVSKQARYILSALVLFTAIIVLLQVFRPEKEVRLREAIAPTVVLVPVVARNLQPVREITGRLRPQHVVRLHFEVSGPVIDRMVEPGQYVLAGEPLLELDASDYSDAVVRAESQLIQEQAGIARDAELYELAVQTRKLARREYDRLEKLGKQDLASESLREQTLQNLITLKLEEARLKYNLDTAQSRVDEQQSALDRAWRDVRRAVLRAPFNARVNQVMLEVGDRADSLQTAVELIDLSALVMYAEVGSDVIAVLSMDQAVELVVDGRRLAGRVTAMQFDPKPATFTHPIEITVADENLVPGELATAILPLRKVDNALVVPLTSVLLEDGKAFVFVARDGRLERRTVTTGARVDGVIEIRGEISGGESVVARDVASMSHGMAVRVESQTEPGINAE